MGDLLRRDQVRQVFVLFHEARELAGWADRTVHLTRGLQRIVGAEMASVGVYGELGATREGTIEESTSSIGGDLQRIWGALRQRGPCFSPSVRALVNRVSGPGTIAVRRRDLLRDGEWYGTEYFSDFYGRAGLDDYVKTMSGLSHRRVATVSVNRAARDRPFSEEDRNLVELFHEECLRLRAPRESVAQATRLTGREKEVLQGLLRGGAEKEVAAVLGISRETVHSHVKSIYRAFRVSSRAELLAKCLGS